MELNTTRQDKVLSNLFAVCQDMPALRATADNPTCGSSYTPLSDVLKAVKPLLTKYGLMAIFTTNLAGQVFTVQMRIIHIDSGEIFGAELSFVINNGSAHEMASLVTYARRYLFDAALNLELGCGADDDNAQVAQRRMVSNARSHQEPELKPTKVTATTDFRETDITPAQALPIVAQEPVIVAPPAIDPKIQEGIRMNNLWSRLKTSIGKPGAEKVLMAAIGTSYIKLVKPDQYAAVCAALEQALAVTPTSQSQAA